MFWSRINTDSDSSKPRPLNSATAANESMSAIDVAEARGNSLAITAVIAVIIVHPQNSFVFTGSKVSPSFKRSTLNDGALIFGAKDVGADQVIDGYLSPIIQAQSRSPRRYADALSTTAGKTFPSEPGRLGIA